MHLLLLTYSNVFLLFLQYSWTNFVYTRCQNVNRKTKDAGREEKMETDTPSTPSKRSKVDPGHHSYPSLMLNFSEDETAHSRNVSLLKQEFTKHKPHIQSITSLMTRTFARRRQWILDDVKRVDEIVLEYPCLTKPVYVSSNCKKVILIIVLSLTAT